MGYVQPPRNWAQQVRQMTQPARRQQVEETGLVMHHEMDPQVLKEVHRVERFIRTTLIVMGSAAAGGILALVISSLFRRGRKD